MYSPRTLFGTDPRGYAPDALTAALAEGGAEAAKIYLLRHFAPVWPGRVAAFDPAARRAEITSWGEVARRVPGWAASWLRADVARAAAVGIDPLRPPLFDDGGVLTLNLSARLPYAGERWAMSAADKNDAAFVADHLLKVACSGKRPLFERLIAWLAGVCGASLGANLGPVCWLRSAPGTGQEALVALLRRVLGGCVAVRGEFALTDSDDPPGTLLRVYESFDARFARYFYRRHAAPGRAGAALAFSSGTAGGAASAPGLIVAESYSPRLPAAHLERLEAACGNGAAFAAYLRGWGRARPG